MDTTTYLLLDGPLNGRYATREQAGPEYVEPDENTQKAWREPILLHVCVRAEAAS